MVWNILDRIELNYKNNYRKCFIFIIVEYFNELRVIII